MEKVVVEPKLLLTYLNKGKLPDISLVEYSLFLYEKSVLSAIRRRFKTRKIKGFTFDCHIVEEKILLCSGFGIGSPAVVGVMEELVAAGAKRFISIGTAGGISLSTKLGDIVICNKAFIDEGTSKHYIPKQVISFPNSALTDEIFIQIFQWFPSSKRGSSWTTDAPFRETFQKLESYQKQDVQAVEMEASALFTLGQYHKVEVASVLIIGDILSITGWAPGFLKREVQNTCKNVAIKLIEYFLNIR